MAERRALAAAAALLGSAIAIGWWHRRRARGLSLSEVAAAAAAAAPAVGNGGAVVPPTETVVATLSRTPSRAKLDGKPLFGLDIGGSLLKLIYLEPDDQADGAILRSLHLLDRMVAPCSKPATADGGSQQPPRAFLEPQLSVHVPALGGRIHFAHFPSTEVSRAVELLRRHQLCEGIDVIHATGGGAHKYRQLIEGELGTSLRPCNELDAVVLGICLMAKAVPDECYTLERVVDPASMAGGDERPQTIIIPSDRLGIVHPLRKIHKVRSPACEIASSSALCMHTTVAACTRRPRAVHAPSSTRADAPTVDARAVRAAALQQRGRGLLPIPPLQCRHRRLHPARPVGDAIHPGLRHRAGRRHLSRAHAVAHTGPPVPGGARCGGQRRRTPRRHARW